MRKLVVDVGSTATKKKSTFPFMMAAIVGMKERERVKMADILGCGRKEVR